MVEAVVICRGAEPTGFLKKLAVPIALEQAFEELWLQSSNSLTRFWDKLFKARPRPRAPRYDETPVTMVVGRLRCSIPGFILNMKL
jgi:hypothetical protein